MLMMLGYFNPRNGYEKKFRFSDRSFSASSSTPFLRQPFRLGKALGKKEKKEVEKKKPIHCSAKMC